MLLSCGILARRAKGGTSNYYGKRISTCSGQLRPSDLFVGKRRKRIQSSVSSIKATPPSYMGLAINVILCIHSF
ncbi:hypothetical protein K504DRAFT_217424 [Pleomassaria siparia CBS 279.74]|uniref:Uncharacterized protein n=1 Tax=Pleomassaria siparia CBS 279.74 TaxID=1314801 RepID=A0A6G1KEY9_9PLEO|nr:hypothetical protein K504DRAFT_217424 [Pleomassaria siparia CBS 279.74]